MKKYREILTFLIILLITATALTQQFESSVYMNHRLIEDKDISILDTIEFKGWAMEEVYDRRVPDYVLRDIAIYQAKWNGGRSMEVQVLKEFYDSSTIEEVLEEFVFPFAHKTGQLPHFLLEGI